MSSLLHSLGAPISFITHLNFLFYTKPSGVLFCNSSEINSGVDVALVNYHCCCFEQAHGKEH